MKIINLKTKIVFNLPKSDAEQLLKVSPDIFAELGKNGRIIKNKNIVIDESILSKILDK